MSPTRHRADTPYRQWCVVTGLTVTPRRGRTHYTLSRNVPSVCVSLRSGNDDATAATVANWSSSLRNGGVPKTSDLVVRSHCYMPQPIGPFTCEHEDILWMLDRLSLSRSLATLFIGDRRLASLLTRLISQVFVDTCARV